MEELKFPPLIVAKQVAAVSERQFKSWKAKFAFAEGCPAERSLLLPTLQRGALPSAAHLSCVVGQCWWRDTAARREWDLAERGKVVQLGGCTNPFFSSLWKSSQVPFAESILYHYNICFSEWLIPHQHGCHSKIIRVYPLVQTWYTVGVISQATPCAWSEWHRLVRCLIAATWECLYWT